MGRLSLLSRWISRSRRDPILEARSLAQEGAKPGDGIRATDWQPNEGQLNGGEAVLHEVVALMAIGALVPYHQPPIT